VFSLDENGEAIFRLFPGYVGFDGYLELVKEEANYWKGYGPYLEKAIRANQQYEDLDEGLELVKKATNLRQSIYNDVKLIDKAEAGSDRLDELEKRIVLKSFELAKLRNEFVDYLYNADIKLRQKYSKKLKEESEDG
jgi:hypothetical protein